MSDIVLDASALLAMLHREPGADVVAQAMPNATISAVNFYEVLSRLSDLGVPQNSAQQTLTELSLRVAPFDQNQAYLAASLRPLTKSAGLSLGDRACLALAMHLEVPVMTADRAWRGLKLDVHVQVVR